MEENDKTMKIEYQDIHVRLGGKEILKGVSLENREGSLTGIIGPNGCGKSTLIKTTFGMCTPSAGTILVDGKPVSSYKPRQLASMIGYVGQEMAGVFDFTVQEVVAMGLYARADHSRPEKEVMEQAMEELGILHLKDRSILSLSGGERKMAYIARAVVQGADTLILDEPTNHLDIRHQLFLLEYLKACKKTVLIVIHDLRLASHYCDYIFLMNGGKVMAQGTPMEALNRQTVRQVFSIEGEACESRNGEKDFAMFL